MKKERLDEALVRLQYADTPELARAIIMEGRVFQNGNRLDKPAILLASDVGLTVKGDKLPYVSRGGLKLEKAASPIACCKRARRKFMQWMWATVCSIGSCATIRAW